MKTHDKIVKTKHPNENQLKSVNKKSKQQPNENQNRNQANARSGGGSKNFKKKRGGSFAERMFKKKDKIGFGQPNTGGNNSRPQFQQSTKIKNQRDLSSALCPIEIQNGRLLSNYLTVLS